VSKQIDAVMLEVLASKICHDLISPIGAVNNGVELIEDMGPDAGPEATALIAFSAQQASAKLQAFRMAYGTGGADANIKPDDVFKAIELIINQDKKIKQEWNVFRKAERFQLQAAVVLKPPSWRKAKTPPCGARRVRLSPLRSTFKASIPNTSMPL
jgi:hypothetical protein